MLEKDPNLKEWETLSNEEQMLFKNPALLAELLEHIPDVVEKIINSMTNTCKNRANIEINKTVTSNILEGKPVPYLDIIRETRVKLGNVSCSGQRITPKKK